MRILHPPPGLVDGSMYGERIMNEVEIDVDKS